MDTAQLPGEILQHYAVQELLGAGAFAKIYRVEDRKSQEELALKVMRRSCYRKRCLEYQIDVELELTQLCQHRNVVTLRDVFDDGEFVIMLMSRATIDLQRATQKLVHMRSLERARLLAPRDSSAPPRKKCFLLADLLSGRWREKQRPHSLYSRDAAARPAAASCSAEPQPLGERQPPLRSQVVVEPLPGKPSAAGAARRETSRRRGGQSSERASSKGRRVELEKSSAPSPTRTPRSIPDSQEFAASEVLRMILMSDCEPGSSVARELQNDPKQQLLPAAELAGGGGVAGATPSTSSPGSSSAVEHSSTAQVQQQKSLLSDSLGPAWGEELSLFLFKQLVAGVEYIHRQGVLHRDLKPENILLTVKSSSSSTSSSAPKQEGLLTLQEINPNVSASASSSSGSAPSTSSRNIFSGTSVVETETGGSSEEQATSTLQLQIADFGWSTKLHRTVGRALAGTYIYMSPEILDGRRHTASSDLWGAGMIWYFLLFGRPLLDQHCIRPGVTDGLTVYDPVRSAQTRARIVRAELNKLCPLRIQDKPEWLQEVVVHEPSGGGATSSSEDTEAEQEDVESSFAEVSEAEAEPRSSHDHARPSATQTTTRSPDGGPPRAYVSTSSTKYFGWRTWLELRNLLSLVPNIRPSAEELLRKLEGRVHRDRP